MWLDLLQWPGMAFGLLGAPLVASAQAKIRRLGFGVWLVSNVAWIVWSIHSQAWGLLAMQAVFCGTSIQGWFNNGPNRQEASLAASPDGGPQIPHSVPTTDR